MVKSEHRYAPNWYRLNQWFWDCTGGFLWERTLVLFLSQNMDEINCWFSCFVLVVDLELFRLICRPISGSRHVQVNLCQKHLFLHQLTHNMTKYCSLIYQFSTWKLQAQNMLCTWIVLNVKTKTKNIFCTQHVLNLYFYRTELVIQWTICCHIVG